MLIVDRIPEKIVGEIHSLLSEDGRRPPDIADCSELHADLGLSSLMIARLILALEEQFAVDPFIEDASAADLRTVGDLVRIYERALDEPIPL